MSLTLKTATAVLEASGKRLATLEKSLAKKKKALQVQEELFQSEPKRTLEDLPAYQYYQKELANCEVVYQRRLEKLEEEYEQKCRFFQDKIDELKSKQRETQPTGKVYRRLKTEVEMEQREYEALKKQLEEESRVYSEVVLPQAVDAKREKALAALRDEERKRKEHEDWLRDQKIAQRKIQEAADEARQNAALEEEQAAEKVEKPPSILKPLSRAPEEKKNPLKETSSSSKTFSTILDRIKDATTAKALEDIANAEKLNDEEDALWNERYDLLVAKEESQRNFKEETNSIVSEVSEAPVLREQMIQSAVDAAIANDMAAQDRIIDMLTTPEMKEYNKRMGAYYAAASAAKPKIPPLGYFQPVTVEAAPLFPPILKTTKKFLVKNPAAPAVASR